MGNINSSTSKGQLISKADWRTIDSPKKRTDEFVLFAFLLFTANKSNFSVRFLEESTAHQSAFWCYLTFNQNCCKELEKYNGTDLRRNFTAVIIFLAEGS